MAKIDAAEIVKIGGVEYYLNGQGQIMHKAAFF
jgi:hypothetical protein